MSTSTALVTVAGFLSIPDPREGHLELHHGEVVVVPPPKWRHQIAQKRIASLLEAQLGKTGVVMTEMAFQPTPEYELWLADVGYNAAKRAADIRDYLVGAPDIVVEVLSPGNTADEMDDRRTICLSNGCSSFWVVNDRRRMVSVTEGGVTKYYGPSEKIASAVLFTAVAVDDIIF